MVSARNLFASLVAVFGVACGAGDNPPVGDDVGPDPVPTLTFLEPENRWVGGVYPLYVAMNVEIVSKVRVFIDGFESTAAQFYDTNDPSEAEVDVDFRALGGGGHILKLVPVSRDGQTGEGDELLVRVDNSAPTLRFLGPSATQTPLDLQFEVSDIGTGVTSASLDYFGFSGPLVEGDPWHLSIEGCIDRDIDVHARDGIGHVTDISFHFAAVDSCDTDCDGRMSVACGGTDCWDSDPDRPSVDDAWGDNVDANCDGVDGADADGDGVPGSGGPDCDDTAAGTHGYWGGWTFTPIGPRFEPNVRPSIANRAGWIAVAYKAHAQVQNPLQIWVVKRSPDGAWTAPTQFGITAVSNTLPPAIALSDDGTAHVLFRSTTGSVIHANDAAGTVAQETVLASGVADELLVDAAGAVHATYREAYGDPMHHGIRGASGWSDETFPWVGSIFEFDGVLTVVTVESGAFTVHGWVSNAWTTQVITSDYLSFGMVTASAAGLDFLTHDPDGTYRAFGDSIGSWPGVVVPGACDSFQVGDDGRTHCIVIGPTDYRLVRENGAWYREPIAAGSRGGLDPQGHLQVVFNSDNNGMSHFAVEGTHTLPASDPPGDGVDQDCDGTDG